MPRPYFAARNVQHRHGEIDANGCVARGAHVDEQVAGTARDFEDAAAANVRDRRTRPRAPASARDERADAIVRECEWIIEEMKGKAQPAPQYSPKQHHADYTCNWARGLVPGFQYGGTTDTRPNPWYDAVN